MKRLMELDVLRGLAIIAVAFDHTWGIQLDFSYPLIQRHLFFSITWFVFMSGITGIKEMKRGQDNPVKKCLKYYFKRIRILIAYVTAVVIIKSLQNFPNIYILPTVLEITGFRMLPHFYFLQLILQLVFLFPFIYYLTFKIKKISWHLMILAGLILYAFILRNLTGPWVHSPENFYLGGPYLPIFYIGMLFGIYIKQIDFKPAVISSLLFIFYEIIALKTDGVFLVYQPNVYFFCWSISLWFMLYFLISKTGKLFNLFWITIAAIGRNSLNVYLYHFYIMLVTLEFKYKYNLPNTVWVMFSIFIPLILSEAVNKLKYYFKYRLAPNQ